MGKEIGKEKGGKKKTEKIMGIIALVLFAIVVCIAIYIMRNNLGLIEGMPWGPGAYYYTDIPNWEKIFWTEEHITCHTNYPVLFGILFVGWAFIAWKALNWLDKHIG